MPPSLRRCVRPGYLRGMRQLRQRESPNPAWWGQAFIAGALAYKLKYDCTAIKRGLGGGPLPLPNAISAYAFSRWGSIDMAEREIQDLCYCIQQNWQVSSRLKLIASFLDIDITPKEDTADVDEMNQHQRKINTTNPTAPEQQLKQLMQSEIATSLYINLVLEVRAFIRLYVNKN